MLELILSYFVSFVFLWAAVIVTAPNPLMYDSLFPLLVLVHVALVAMAVRYGGSSRSLFLCIAAGTSLSLAELTRPFALLIVPPLLICAAVALRRHPEERETTTCTNGTPNTTECAATATKR